MLNFFEQKRINNQAKSDLKKKLKLERTFMPEIKKIFSKMNRDFKTYIAVDGIPPSASTYQAQWESVLKNHYERVQREFAGSVQDFNKSKLLHIEKKIIGTILGLTLLKWAEARSRRQARFITNTNQKDMVDSVNEAKGSLTQQDLPVDNRSVSMAASTILARKTLGRAKTISIVETQAPAENTKLEESKIIRAEIEREDIFKKSKVIKIWNTIGDKIVRMTHRLANLQKQDIDDPFDIGGSSMMYPGDSSMGAPAKEFMNCRCSLVYKF